MKNKKEVISFAQAMGFPGGKAYAELHHKKRRDCAQNLHFCKQSGEEYIYCEDEHQQKLVVPAVIGMSKKPVVRRAVPSRAVQTPRQL